MRLASILESAEGKVDSEVLSATESALAAFQAMGHTVEPVKLDPAALLVGITGTIINAGVSSVPMPNPDLMDPVVRMSWDQGKNIKAADYLGAVSQMHNISRNRPDARPL